MKKKYRITLIVLGCIALVFSAAFVAFSFTQRLLLGMTSAQNAEYVKTLFELVKGLFVYPFDAKSGAMLASVLEGNANALGVSIANLVLTALVFIAFVLGLVFAIVKKKKIFGFVLPVLLVGGFVGMLSYVVLPINLSGMVNANGNTNLFLVSFFTFIFACVGFILAVLTYVLALVFANKKEEPLAIEAQVLPEEAGNPEAVQEGEALSYSIPEVEAAPEIEPIREENIEEPVAESAVEPEKEVAPEPEPSHVEVNVNNAPNGGIDQNSLASLLREVVRDIVRDEIARNNANQPQQSNQPNGSSQNITGATFGGPLVVQYFNGGINGVNPYVPPKQEEKPVEPAPKKEPEPVKEEKPAAEPAPVPAVEVKPAAPLFVKKEVPEGQPEKPKYERLTFAQRLLQSEKDVQDLYNELKNEILSYGVKSRISANGDTFRLHKKMYVRITVAGKSLKLYFALNPADYADTKLPIQDASGKDMYAEIPLVFKVKSGLSVRRCKELIQDTMDKDGLEQGEIGKVNWIKELKADLASGKKSEDKDED